MLPGELHWLAPAQDWKARLQAARQAPAAGRWTALVELAGLRLDFLQTNALDRLSRESFGEAPPPDLATRPVRLAVLGSSTVDHLLPALRVAGLRRGLWVQTYASPYGQYHQELISPASGLRDFGADAVLLALDARHAVGLAEGPDAESAAADRLAELWVQAKAICSGPVIQQALMPVFPALLGEAEHRLASSKAWRAQAINAEMRRRSDVAGVEILGLDQWAAKQGVDAWHDVSLWHRAKQEIRPTVAPLYGDLVGRLLAAAQGLSAKCLVLDLDNTLWGGVIGDDGLDGIVLGQGGAEGEAFLDFQRYALALAARGVILAVCSKNDEANALSPFERHPDMALRRSDIGCFVANWEPKPDNLRRIARELNIGLDALVFADDNPFERSLVRRELPMVRVPELPEDPAGYAACIADGGYFETLRVTEEDLQRTGQYQAAAGREALKAEATDLSAYLASLRLELTHRPFDRAGLPRIVQLINKTNQFNLTTRRYAEDEVADLLDRAEALTLQLRLTDAFGDNGMIAVVIALPDPETPGELSIDTWLMSCRVLGRQVEDATLNLLAAEARRRGYRALAGTFRPTAKNGMVRDHYSKLGFAPAGEAEDGAARWRLDLETFAERPTFISIAEA